jgi:hypothetical protein
MENAFFGFVITFLSSFRRSGFRRSGVAAGRRGAGSPTDDRLDTNRRFDLQAEA